MSKWLLRGLVFAALMVVIRLLQGALINVFETQALLISIALVVLYAIGALVWGLSDGRGDARANPDPDRRSDLAMTWLLAGLFAGVVSGFVAWFISLFYDNVYAESILNEITTFAAFTALLTFVFAIAGVAVGRLLVDRKAPPQQRRSAEDDRADTDVFAAVGARDYPDEETATERTDSARTDSYPTATTTTATESATKESATTESPATTESRDVEPTGSEADRDRR